MQEEAPIMHIGDDLSQELRGYFVPMNYMGTGGAYIPVPTLIPDGPVFLPKEENVNRETIDSSIYASEGSSHVQDDVHEEQDWTDKTKEFIQLLRQTIFEDGMYNIAYDKFENLRVEMGDYFSEWVANICRDNLNDDEIIIKLLTIFADYDYNELSAVQPWIVMANINNRSNAVKSAALQIIDSWHNQEALDFLSHFEVPQEPWLRMKYMTIRRDIENVLRA